MHEQKFHAYWLQGMTKAAAHTAWGLFFTAAEQAEIAGPLSEALVSAPWGPYLCKHAAANAIRPGTAMFAPNGLRLPRFTSWILPFRLDQIRSSSSVVLGTIVCLSIPLHVPIRISFCNTYEPITVHTV